MKKFPKVYDPHMLRYIVADKVSAKLFPYTDGHFEQLVQGQIVQRDLTQEEWKQERIALFMFRPDLEI